MSTRKQMSVTVEQWVVDAIDEVKPALAAGCGGVREFLVIGGKSSNYLALPNFTQVLALLLVPDRSTQVEVQDLRLQNF